MREVYLAPFEAAVEAGVWAVMSAYNQVNGCTMAASPLLEQPLKSEWGFDGPVVSDWGAVRTLLDTAGSAQDLAMPGPRGPWADGLLAAVEQGLVDRQLLDDKVRRLLRLAGRVGGLGRPELVWRPAVSPVTQRALLRRATAAGAVLLRNEGGLLPLDPAGLSSIAVIGAPARNVRIQGGGSAEVFPASVVSPLEGIQRAAGGGTQVTYAPGQAPSALPRPLDRSWARDPRSGEPGVLVRLLDAAGAELHAEHRLSGRIVEPSVRVDGAETVEIRALVRPDTGGRWTWAVGGWGPMSLCVDGREVLAGTFPLDSDDPTRVHVAPPTGRPRRRSRRTPRSRSSPGAAWRRGQVWQRSWRRLPRWVTAPRRSRPPWPRRGPRMSRWSSWAPPRRASRRATTVKGSACRTARTSSSWRSCGPTRARW